LASVFAKLGFRGTQIPSQFANRPIQGAFIYKRPPSGENEPKFKAQAGVTSSEFWIAVAGPFYRG
jgi:hypothetical protein